MILYLDSSALVKLYVEEEGSEEIQSRCSEAEAVGTSLITRSEVSAAFAKSVRMGIMTETQGRSVLEQFRKDWPDLVRINLSDHVISQADLLAWDHNLRGYDAVQLASALFWQEGIGEEITLACFDQRLRNAGEEAGLTLAP